MTDPLSLFDAWYQEARTSETSDPNAMAVATATRDAVPSVRMVLLKEHGPEGFVFYTNLGSRKGEELAANPRAALCFHWKSTYKQVRIEGPITLVSDAEADAYFASRERSKQLAAIASQQSRPLPSYDVLEDKVAALDALHAEKRPPRPAHWTGVRVIPDRFEFWEGTQDRMHHRRLLLADGHGGWAETLLYP
ncbi:pyridoxamine 5'-phosphate oxidase [Sphingomicrobium flavum]|uniref:pyridoxamine 5'-phosphate oxidase n=1 Tax=Sphingomicrobium flavum TaxID=1229164 RepID=UPI0021AE04B9|nr:pyridoxamine 5'-phosphate oxidase [Sphingomicrobium flavum]